MNPRRPTPRRTGRPRGPVLAILLGASFFLGARPAAAQERAATPAAASTPPTLEEMRLAMGKWIETQQIVAKERKEWQQGKEILTSRLDLVKKEIATLEEKIEKAQASVVKATQKRDELLAENETLKTTTAKLAQAVTAIEGDVRRLLPLLPEPVLAKVQPLVQRIPADAATTRVAVAERFQNALVILGEVDKANADIAVAYEVRTLPGGKRSEVQALYIGLGQAYYVSADGDAGIGRPTPEGWRWEPSASVAHDLFVALEILQGKHTPAFVPLPVVLQ